MDRKHIYKPGFNKIHFVRTCLYLLIDQYRVFRSLNISCSKCRKLGRKCRNTHYESSNVQVAESLACVCQHSLCTKIKVYDQSQHERTKCALQYLNQWAINAIVDDTPGTSYNADDEEEDLKGEGSDPPPPGERYACLSPCTHALHHPRFSWLRF